MAEQDKNIFPTHDLFLDRNSKEKLLKQRAKVLWFTGLSGSGKSTIANGVEHELQRMGYLTMLLDGDNVRIGINNDLGFSPEDRNENIRRIAEVSKLLINCGVITLCCFVSPTEDIRNMARSIIGMNDFIEIYVNASVEECEKRDVKGLYAKARKGEIKDFTGVNAPFEIPQTAELEVKTYNSTIVESVKSVLDYVLPLVRYNGEKQTDKFL